MPKLEANSKADLTWVRLGAPIHSTSSGETKVSPITYSTLATLSSATKANVDFKAFALKMGLSQAFANAVEDSTQKTVTATFSQNFQGKTYWQEVIVYNTDLGRINFPTDNI